ncbi:grainyhead-like protein 1 homolog isoform X2 [Dendronephthya gigantea]|nr:grainyhead-like protein 1 homolog isoform X2 [Dendronephthya gigantea]
MQENKNSAAKNSDKLNKDVSLSTSGEPDRDGASDQEDRGKEFLKAYFSSDSSDNSALTASLLAQVSADDPSVAASLGLLYDYYVQESAHSPTSPTSESENGNAGNSSLADVLNHESVTVVQSDVSELKRRSDGDPQRRVVNRPSQGRSSTSTSVEALRYPIVKQQTSPSDCRRKSEGQSSAVISSVSPASSSDISPIVLRNEGFNYTCYDPPMKPQTLFAAQEKYCFTLEAPPSIIQRRGEDSLTYLNKGQFYSINFEANPTQSDGAENTQVKSILHLVFRDEKDPNVEIQHWRYWHAQQANPQQRAFDIDRKSCANIEDHVDEIAYNAAAFYWDTKVNAKIVLRMNCLSTDFSSQKGVKGIPLHLQIDTYEDVGVADAEPIHRAFCQIKIFRDKGAERKNKDESKSAEKRMQKLMQKQSSSFSDSPSTISPSVFQAPVKITKLTPTTPLGPKPILFSPTECFPINEAALQSATFLHAVKENENKRRLKASLDIANDELADLEFIPRNKAQRVQRPPRPAVTIYVKKEEEKVYNALMLDSFGVIDLREAVAQKYDIPPEMIKAVYKKTKKGILVNMDDRMVEQFVDEDDFIIKIDFDNQLGHFELTLFY